MLVPQVTSGAWHRWLVRSSIAVGAVAATFGALQWIATSAQTPPLVMMPSVTVVRETPEASAPAPAAAPAAIVEPADDPPPTPPTPSVVHRRCAPDLAVVGVPLGTPSSSGEISAASTRDGCTLAVWTVLSLDVSWDGGQTFETLPTDLAASHVAVTPDRVVVTSNDMIGVAHASSTTGTLTWHPLGQAKPDSAETDWSVFAAGDWIALTSLDSGLDDTVKRYAAVSHDEGATWIYVEVPAKDAMFTGITADGHLTAEVKTARADDRFPVPLSTTRWSYDLGRAAWRQVDRVAGNVTARTDAVAYSLVPSPNKDVETDQLIAFGRGDRTRLRTNLSEDVADFFVVAGHDLAYVLDSHVDAEPSTPSTLDRLAGTRQTPIAGARDWKLEMVGVDASGSLIAIANDSNLVRWSPRGGWRVLFTHVDPDSGDH